MHEETLRRICREAADWAFRRNFPERCAERHDSDDATLAVDDDEHVDASGFERAAAEAEAAQRAQRAHLDALWKQPIGDASEAPTAEPACSAEQSKTSAGQHDSDDARERMARDAEQAWRRPLTP